MIKNKLIFFFLIIFSLAFDFYCESAIDRSRREREEKKQYCKNVIKELDEIIRPKLRETYERYYRQGSCTEDSDCVGIQVLRNCSYSSEENSECQEIFYRNFEEQFRSETHDMHEKCKSRYVSCRASFWPYEPIFECPSSLVRCVNNQCKLVDYF